MRKILLVTTLVGIFVVAAFGWHVAFTIGIKQEFQKQNAKLKVEDVETEMSIDIFTNLVTVTVTQPAPNPDSPFTLEAIGLLFAGEIAKATAPRVLERKINATAREYYDLYARLVPYKVRMVSLTKKKRVY